MDEKRAQELLMAERKMVEDSLATLKTDADSAKEAQLNTGDLADPAEPLTAEGTNDAVARQLEDRLEAISRAERRLEEGTYGRSVRSGLPLPDERLEADPAAELTVEEAEESQ